MSGKRVLIVDDDTDLLEMVCLLVLSNNMEAICVHSKEEAISSLNQQHFDLLLMDIFLGDYDGREIAKALKSDDQFKSLPILLYSAGQITHSSITESRADAFMPKPFNAAELIKKIRQLMVG